MMNINNSILISIGAETLVVVATEELDSLVVSEAIGDHVESIVSAHSDCGVTEPFIAEEVAVPSASIQEMAPINEVVKVVVIGIVADGESPTLPKQLDVVMEEGELTPTFASNSKKRKKRKKSKSKAQHGPFAGMPSVVSPVLAQATSKKDNLVDEDGFTQVPNKRTLRSQGDVVTYSLL